MPDSQYAYVLGRFQPIHNGHMEYLDAAFSRCDHLVVGITNPDPEVSDYRAADPKRSERSANPYSYWERHQMITVALLDAGYASGSFTIVPSPITAPERLPAYMPQPDQTTCFVTVYDDWGRQKARELEQLGYRINVLWERGMETRITTGTYLRRAIPEGDGWEHLVPSAVVSHLKAMSDRLTGAEVES